MNFARAILEPMLLATIRSCYGSFPSNKDTFVSHPFPLWVDIVEKVRQQIEVDLTARLKAD